MHSAQCTYICVCSVCFDIVFWFVFVVFCRLFLFSMLLDMPSTQSLWFSCRFYEINPDSNKLYDLYEYGNEIELPIDLCKLLLYHCVYLLWWAINHSISEHTITFHVENSFLLLLLLLSIWTYDELRLCMQIKIKCSRIDSYNHQ